MIDRDHLEELMRLRGFKSGAALARKAGIGTRQTVNRILGGETSAKDIKWETIARIAMALDVSTDELFLDAQPAQVWRSFPWTDRKSLRQLFEDLNNVNSCLMCTQGMETYLQHDAMHSWVFHQMQRAVGWEEQRIDKALQVVRRNVSPGDLNVRMRADTVHRVIVRERFFQQTYRHESDWVATTRTLLDELEGRTILGIVPELHWAQVSNKVLSALRRCVGTYHVWDKLCVADNTFALFRPTLDEFQVTVHPPTVNFLRSTLEAIARTYVPYEFCLGFSASGLEATTKQTKHKLDDIARRAGITQENDLRIQQAERKYWARLALGAKC